jgi:hemin uptake protein HemP
MQDDKLDTPSETSTPGDAASSASPVGGTRRVSSAELFAGAREIEIEHNGRRYQLRITQTGKLILTA